jgi:hypothetical protein
MAVAKEKGDDCFIIPGEHENNAYRVLTGS